MRRAIMHFFAIPLFGTLAFAAADHKGASAAGQQMPAQTQHAQPTGDVFKSQCSRCHTLPMSLSPRITGTVIMHMRVRARLSRRDEQPLLKFMAP